MNRLKEGRISGDAERRLKRTKVQPIGRLTVDLMDKGLPCNLDAERLVLGSVLLDGSRFPEVSSLRPEDFSEERHRRIFATMHHLYILPEHIDRITVYEEMARQGIAGADPISFLHSLDEGMPHISHLDSYVRIILNKSTLRQTIFAAQHLMNECLLEGAATSEIVASHLAKIQELSQRGSTGQVIVDLPSVRDCASRVVEYLRAPELPRGAVIALTGDSGSGKSTLASAWAGEVAVAGIPVLVLDRENPGSVVAERLDRLGISDGGLLRCWGGWSPRPVPQPADTVVLAWVESCERKPLVIVDSMVAFHGGDENDAGQMRAFMQQCRTLADLGATVVVIHHDGKAETAKDYRGSSDFKAAVDAAFHVSNSGADGRLGLVRLRCYKSRLGFGGEILYRYTGDRFVLDRDPNAASRNVNGQLADLLRMNPGIKATDFEVLAMKQDLGRKRAREYLHDGVRAGGIRLDGKGNAKQHYLLIESEPDAK